MRVVFANTLDENKPSGGAKQAYRHVDVLNQIGIDACFAHPIKDFRYTWFENQTPTVHIDDISLTADDFLIFGELVHEVPRIKGWERCGKVILCQNAYNAIGGFKLDLCNIRQCYREAAAVLCPSDHAETNLKFLFPSAKVMRFRYSFDRPPWAFHQRKDKLVAVMPRKRASEIDALLAVTGLRWMPPGWNLFRMDGVSEADVAKAFRHCAAFLSLSEKEGFGMPPAEAMACGCIVVGYTGFAGKEFMLPGITFPVEDGDYIGLGKALVDVFFMPEEDRMEMAHKASTFIQSRYSTKAEVDSIREAWGKITRPVIEIRTEARERMKKEVAVYMPVYNEGPYMETLLKWLVPRVGAIFVAESIFPWSLNGVPGGESKKVVDKVLADCPEAKDIIQYVPVGNEEDKDDALLREAKQRNEVLAKIRDSGFKFVWMVEADEFYRDAEAEALWDWFFDRAEEGARAANCLWQTYWRSVHWRIDPPEFFRPNVAFLSSCQFAHGRLLSEADEAFQVEVPERACVVRHYSWARTPADVRKKLSAWGHAKETNPEWYEKVFMAWKPGDPMSNLHPTRPEAYRSVVRCDLPVPEAMAGHPFLGLEIIDEEGSPVVPIAPQERAKVVMDVTKRPRIKAVIMHHNKPENTDRLYDQLAPVFDDVEVFDNGSDPGRVPIHVTRSRENVYWTGTWNEVMATCSDYDAVWVLGCDIELKDSPEEYRKAIESSLPFGCWSPCITGRAHPFMQAANFIDRQPKEVKNIEGMALAASGQLMKVIGELPAGSQIGFGQDFWMCHRAREAGLRNVLDGRVSVKHPEGIGYDEEAACRQMDETFGKMYGPDYRRTIFEYDERFEYNVVGGMKMKGNKKFTIVTVDNGWGLAEFARVTSKVEDCRRIVMQKGVVENVPVDGIEFVPYDPNLSVLFREADVALFPRVGVANSDDYMKLLKSGVPMVVRESCAQNKIEHMRNGWLFRDETWALHWLSFLRGNPGERQRVRRDAEVPVVVESQAPVSVVTPEPESVVVPVERPLKAVKVTVITPTRNRAPEVIWRCISSMLLQGEKDWEQVVCSDGEKEDHVAKLVLDVGDDRIRYEYTTERKSNDFGNTVRASMLARARGEFVLFFDDDNVILPHYLERMLAALASAKADFAVCQIMHFGPLNEEAEGKPPKVLTGDPVKLYHIDPLQVVVRREVMQKVGWDTEVGYLSDGVSLERLNPFKVVRVNEVLGIHM